MSTGEATERLWDDDFSQPGALVPEVMDDAQRERLVSNISGHLGGVSVPVRARAVDYWRNVDKRVGDAVASNVGV